MLLDGQALATMNPRDLVRVHCRKVGFVFQTFNLIPNLTAVENVMLPLEFARVDGSEASRSLPVGAGGACS